MPAKDRIVAAARQLFAERGFHRTAMADLAEHSQVSVGTIYRSYASKSDIIRAIIREETEETLELLQTTIEQVRSGEVAGEAAIERLVFEWIAQRSDALEHEVVAEGHRNPEMTAVISEICGQFRELFRVLARVLQPDLDDVEIEGLAELLLACLFGMGNREFTFPRLDEAQTAAVVARLLLRSAKGAG